MTDKQMLQKCIDESNWPNLIKALFIMVYWMMQKITAAECASFCIQISYTFDTSTYALSDGTNSYTILQALTTACEDIYPNKVTLGPPLMKAIIGTAKTENYITQSDYDMLVAQL